MLVQADDSSGVFDILIGQLADVYQPLGVYAYIDKGSEVGNVADDAGQNHSRTKVGKFVYRGIESKLREGLAWVAAGFLQLGHNVL